MIAVTAGTIADLALDPPADRDEVFEFDSDNDRAPGMPLLGFLVAIVLSAGLWALIGLTAWAIIG